MQPGTVVRKLPCKHIFHDLCVVAWLGSRGGAPHCPMCKANPFASLFEQEEPPSGPVDASQLQLQVDEASVGNEAFRLSPEAPVSV